MKQSFASAARLQGGGNPFLSSASKPGSKSGSATSDRDRQPSRERADAETMYSVSCGWGG
jgi:hypothetical protein